MSLPERLPLFPLGIVLYPDEPVPLHIFEPRYREMTRHCLASDEPFGILYAADGRMAAIGTTARIRRVINQYDDGRSDILCVGEDRFRVVETFDDRPYLSAEAEPFGEASAEPEDVALRERVITQHMKLLEMAGEPIRPAVYQDARWVSFAVAQNAGLEPVQKQQLLEMPAERERVAFLAAHFARMLGRVERVRQLRDLAQGDGYATGTPGIEGLGEEGEK